MVACHNSSCYDQEPLASGVYFFTVIFRSHFHNSLLFIASISVLSRSTVNLQPSQRYWPEFTVSELLSETWGVPQADGKKKAPDGSDSRTSQSGWSDDQPMARLLPDGLKAYKWVKATEYLSSIREKNEHAELSMFHVPTPSQPELHSEKKVSTNNDYDFESKNADLFKNSHTMKRISDEISLLYSAFVNIVHIKNSCI